MKCRNLTFLFRPRDVDPVVFHPYPLVKKIKQIYSEKKGNYPIKGIEGINSTSRQATYSSLSWLVSSGARYISLMKDSLSKFGDVVRAIVISNTLPNKGANQLKTQRGGKKAGAPQLQPPRSLLQTGDK